MLRTLCAALILTISLSSCGSLAGKVADMALGGSQPGVEVDANVAKGDAEGDDSVAQNANTAVSVGGASKEVYEGSVGQVVNQSGLKLYELLLLVLLAGWAIPSPAQCVLGGVRVFREAIDIALGRKL